MASSKKISDEELLQRVNNEISDALGYNDTLNEQRETANECIVPTHIPGMNSAETRENPLSLNISRIPPKKAPPLLQHVPERGGIYYHYFFRAFGAVLT